MSDKYINPTGLQTIKNWIDSQLSAKQDALTAGDNIDITNDIISVDGVVPASTITNGIPYGVVDGTSTSTAFTATVDGVTELVDGTCVMLKNGVVTSATGFTINVNNLGAKPVYSSMSAATAESSLFNVAYTMLFVYDSTRVAGGAWILYRGYNSDTTVGRGVIDYYYRPYAGQTIYRYKLCMQGADNRLYPIVVTNQSKATQVSKQPTAIPLRASAGVWYYSATATVNAGDAVGAQLLYPSYYLTTCAYNFNTATGTYKNVYLRGSYDKATDLFTLYNDGAATPTSYYAFVPCNTANITLSEYFVTGYYYILLGGTYSTTNYLSLFDNNPIYYFDGTNLIPVSTKVAQEVANTAASEKQDTVTANGILKGNGSGTITAAVAGTDYQTPLVAGTDYQTPLVAGTDYQTPLPSQSGNSGKFLTTNGSAMSWGSIPAPPSAYTSNPAMDGTASAGSSSNYAKGDHVHPTDTSRQAKITASGLLKGDGNGGVSAAVSGTDYQLPLTAGTDYQTPLTFDNTPTSGSSNPVTSGGIYTALSGKQATLTFDNAPTANSNNPVKSGGIYTAIQDVDRFFIAAYGTTTLSELEAAYQAGKTLICVDTTNEIVYPSFYRVSSSHFQFFTIYSNYQLAVADCTTNNAWSHLIYDVALLNSPHFTGAPTAPTASAGTSTKQIATTAFVSNAVSSKLDKSGGTMTGALILSGAPTQDLNPATKKYVDDICGDIETALSTINTSLGGMV